MIYETRVTRVLQQKDQRFFVGEDNQFHFQNEYEVVYEEIYPCKSGMKWGEEQADHTEKSVRMWIERQCTSDKHYYGHSIQLGDVIVITVENRSAALSHSEFPEVEDLTAYVRMATGWKQITQSNIRQLLIKTIYGREEEYDSEG